MKRLVLLAVLAITSIACKNESKKETQQTGRSAVDFTNKISLFSGIVKNTDSSEQNNKKSGNEDKNCEIVRSNRKIIVLKQEDSPVGKK